MDGRGCPNFKVIMYGSRGGPSNLRLVFNKANYCRVGSRIEPRSYRRVRGRFFGWS
jgi:hypothetical protein